jgi:predicted Zn-dependent protease
LSLALGTVIVIGCATISETGEKRLVLISPDQEASLGAESFTALKNEGKISKDPAANAQVKNVVNRLIPHVKTSSPTVWETLVFEDPTPNAFALPGGKVGVHTGILPITQNDAGLATVLGHELAHVSLRHGAQRISRQLALSGFLSLTDFYAQASQWKHREIIMGGLGAGANVGVVLPFSRDNELEADRIGLRYMALAGYDPREAVAFWQRMEAASSGQKPPEWLSTHPADSRRIAQLQSLLPEALTFYQAR